MPEDGGLSAAPPQNLEAERELLGSLLAYYTPDLLAACVAAVEFEDFYRTAHGLIFRAIRAVGHRGEHVDGLTVARFLQCQRDHRHGSTYLEQVGGRAQVEFLVAHAVPHGVAERARIVHEDGEWRRRLRRLYDAEAACHARDETAYQAALSGETPRLRVIAGGERAQRAAADAG